MLSYQYRRSHCGDKTVIRSSYLHNGISYTGKDVIFILSQAPGPLLQHELTWIPAWISNHMLNKMWDEMSYLTVAISALLR